MKNKLFLIIITLTLFSCRDVKERRNFFNGEFRTISFDKEYILSGEQLFVDSLGTVIVDLFDPYLIVRNRKVSGINFFTKFYSLEDYKYIGEYFRMGNAPQEFRSFNVIKKEYPNLWTYDFYEKHVLKFNLEKGMDERSLILEKKYDYQSIPNTFNVFFINDTCLLIKSYNFEEKVLEYISYNPENGTKFETYKTINYPITDEFTFKILSMADNIHPDGSKIVFITGKFNQVDVLDLKNPRKNFSVSTANNFVPYGYIEKTNEEELRDYYYSFPYCGDEFVAVLFDVSGDESKSEIHVIDWTGNPLAKMKFEGRFYFITFEIDPVRKLLYGVTKEGLVYIYDLKTCDFLYAH